MKSAGFEMTGFKESVVWSVASTNLKGSKSYSGVKGLAEPRGLRKLPLSGHTAHGLPELPARPAADSPKRTLDGYGEDGCSPRADGTARLSPAPEMPGVSRYFRFAQKAAYTFWKAPLLSR